MKTESIQEWLARGGTIKRVNVSEQWERLKQPLPSEVHNAKLRRRGAMRAKATNTPLIRRTRESAKAEL